MKTAPTPEPTRAVHLDAEQRDYLEQVAHKFFFLTTKAGDWTTIYGPTITYGSITLTHETADVRLLNEVASAVAQGTSKTLPGVSRLEMPLYAERQLLHSTSSAFRKLHEDYRPIFNNLMHDHYGADNEQ